MSKKISQDNPNAWRNPWVIGWIALVVVVLGVNIVMISLAFITNPGLVTEDYYEQGRDHEQNVNKRIAARAALAWSFSADFPIDPVMNRNERYRFTAVDRNGMPLTNGQAALKAYRPSDADADFLVTMSETVPGVYEADVRYPLKGYWEITVSLKHGEDESDFTRRANVVTN